jgi:hypothetical protein
MAEAAETIACCAHSRVLQHQEKQPGGTYIERWRCDSCSTEFVRAVAHLPLRAEIAGLKLDFAKDQAELASMRITLAEKTADLENAAKVTEELIDGLAEETRKRNVAEVEVERLRDQVGELCIDKEELRDLVYEVICWNNKLQKRPMGQMMDALAAAYRRTAGA